MSKLLLDLHKIRIAMARAVLNESALAERAGWSSPWVNQLLARIGEGNAVGTKVAGTLAKALAVDVTELIQSNERADGDTKAA